MKWFEPQRPMMTRQPTVPPRPVAAKPTALPIPLNKKCSCDGGCPICVTKRSSTYQATEDHANRMARQALQGKAPPAGAEVSSDQALQGPPQEEQGTIMAQEERRTLEYRFGHDFSRVRIHRGARARQLTSSLGAQAFTYGRHLYFNHAAYAPFTTAGRELLAHELAHVVQQERSQKPCVHCWPASIHQTITKDIINAYFSGQFSADALVKLAFYAGQLDQRGCNYLYYGQDFLLAKMPIIGTIIKSPHIPILSLFTETLSDYEAPNHGEANLYKYKGSKTKDNEARAKEHLAKALSLMSDGKITKQAMVYWGMALHVGQDRGSHQEGIKGKGHDRKTDDQGRSWNCDDPKDNGQGYETAKTNTQALISQFLQALSAAQKASLKTADFGALAGQGKLQVGTMPAPNNPAIPKDSVSRRLVYMTIMKQLLYGKDDMPKRLLGVLPIMTQVGLGITGSAHKRLSVEPQLGLRVMKPTPLSYVDVLTGPSLGIGLDQKKATFGWSLAAQLGLIGEQDDLNLMINQSWSTAGSTTVVGLSGTFDEVALIKKLFGK